MSEIIKLLALGVWVSVCALASALGVMTWQQGKLEKHTDAAVAEMTPLKTRNISVPMLEAGQVQGYVVAKFEFSVDAAKMKSTTVSPESLVADEAFKLIYSRDVSDISSIRKQDLRTLTDNIEQGVNKRVGVALVQHVLIENWSYLSKEDVVKQNGHDEK
jgi:hypothetical protein